MRSPISAAGSRSFPCPKKIPSSCSIALDGCRLPHTSAVPCCPVHSERTPRLPEKALFSDFPFYPRLLPFPELPLVGFVHFDRYSPGVFAASTCNIIPAHRRHRVWIADKSEVGCCFTSCDLRLVCHSHPTRHQRRPRKSPSTSVGSVARESSLPAGLQCPCHLPERRVRKVCQKRQQAYYIFSP